MATRNNHLTTLVQGLCRRLKPRWGAVHEKDYENRADFEAEARRRQGAVIIYSTEPLGFGVNLPEIEG